jgi:hypothetical protein
VADVRVEVNFYWDHGPAMEVNWIPRTCPHGHDLRAHTDALDTATQREWMDGPLAA